MPALKGFSDNDFQSREDVERAAVVLLRSLCQYQSPGGARIKIPVATGAHFDEVAAQLEGYARPLWTIGALLAGTDGSDETINRLAEPFIRGLANGTDPDHAEYWGPVVVCDQRMVEMEIISYALLSAPHAFYHSQKPQAQENIKAWLATINDKPMPPTNWRWFRVFTNLALIKVCGVSKDQMQAAIESDLELLETFYLGQGWSSDGPWSEQGRQADYYSGSFAIQFSQLMYVKFAADSDPDRCSKYRERAYLFSAKFHEYFDQNGAAIPFGRSLTYRFAMAGFWAAAAFAEVPLSSPVNSDSATRGILHRHFRWWASKPDIFNADGTLTIGFVYPNMYMCEDYNSPQSVYWCMKSFCHLGLPKDHAYWTAREASAQSAIRSLSTTVEPPMHIICNSGSHHYLLSSGQYCPWPLKATEAKYSKFAYSSHFGFSVPTGPLIQQIAPDSSLAVKIKSDDSWKLRWIAKQAKYASAVLHMNGEHEQVPVLTSSWKPWAMLDITVYTALVASCKRWPNWHVRVHKISVGADTPKMGLDLVEGGFAIYGRTLSDGLPVPVSSDLSHAAKGLESGSIELSSTGEDACLLVSSQGVSGIRASSLVDLSDGWFANNVSGSLLKPDSNTNLMCQRTVIPTLTGSIQLQTRDIRQDFYLVTCVFAMRTVSSDFLEEWNDVPKLCLGSIEQALEGTTCIALEDFTKVE